MHRGDSYMRSLASAGAVISGVALFVAAAHVNSFPDRITENTIAKTIHEHNAVLLLGQGRRWGSKIKSTFRYCIFFAQTRGVGPMLV